jgi:hypothetical protein
MDLRFGAKSFLCICYEIAQDETNYISWQFDHGKRKGIEHFVKLISWGGFDDEGNRVVKAFCVDSKMCGHSAIESAMSIKEVSDVMHIVLPEIENISGTSNSGGGAAIQHTWLEVVLRVVAPKDSTINNCDLHGMNLPLKEALEDALGQPCIGHNSPWQLEFVAKLFLHQLKEIYGKAIRWMRCGVANPRFQKEVMRLGGKCFSKYYDDIQIKANSEPEKVMELLNKLPGNLRDPVFTC